MVRRNSNLNGFGASDVGVIAGMGCLGLVLSIAFYLAIIAGGLFLLKWILF